MKVKRMIEELNKYAPEADVIIGRLPVIFICARADNPNIVWLETEDDCDMGEQLWQHFKDAAEDPTTDELDFYTDMLEMGVTIDCVRKYMGDETADHMLCFCKEHGLL